MDCSMPGLPAPHYLLEFAQVHVHWISDAIQPSHPLLPSSFAFSFPASGSFPVSWLFTSGGQSIRVCQLQHQSFQWQFKSWFPLGFTGLIIPTRFLASLVAQTVKSLPAIWETWVRSLSWEDPLEKKMAIPFGILEFSSILAWRIPWTEEPGGLLSMGLQRVRHDWVTNIHNGFLSKSEVTQSCPTVCDPMDCSPPSSSVHGDSSGNNTGVGCHFLLHTGLLISVKNIM